MSWARRPYSLIVVQVTHFTLVVCCIMKKEKSLTAQELDIFCMEIFILFEFYFNPKNVFYLVLHPFVKNTFH